MQITTILVVLSVGMFLPGRSTAQDLEPRFLSDVPIRTNFVIASYGYSNGNILLDNSLPVDNLNASLNNLVVGYARSFKLFGKLAKVDAVVPYSFARFKGSVYDIDSSVSRRGFGDPLLRFSIILIGGKPLKAAEFMKRQEKPFSLGVTVRIRIPLGQYDHSKLLNLGANRWAVKIGVAASYTFVKRLVLECHLNTWFFTKNTDFFNGNTVQQQPMITGQLHLTWIFSPGTWIAGSFGLSGLGETTVNDIKKEDKQSNFKYGLALGHKINRNNALKFAFTSGVTTRYGASFTTVLVAYQFMWFDKR